jgi:hypothetical protein
MAFGRIRRVEGRHRKIVFWIVLVMLCLAVGALLT